MADISNLQVQITANTTQANSSIDKLISKLSALNKALSNYADNSAYIKGLYSLASGLTKVGSAANGIDSTKISSFASSLDSLYKVGTKLSDINFSSLGAGLRNIQSVNISGDKFAGIKVLSESLGKLTGTNYEKAKSALPTLAKSLSSFSGISIPNYGGKLVELADSLGKFGSKAMVRAQGLPQVAEGLRALQGIQIPNIEDIQLLAKSLSKFGGVSIERAIYQMPQLAQSFTDLLTSVSKAPQVSTQTVRFAEAMAKLSTSARSTSTSMKGVTTNTTLFKNAIMSTIPTMNRVRVSTFNLASMFGKLYASYFLIIRGVKKLGAAIEYSSQLTEVQNVVAHTFGEQAYLMDEFADRSIKDYGMAELSAKQFASRFQAMGSAMGITAKQIGTANDFISKKIGETADDYKNLGSSMADLSIDLTKLTADYASFFNQDYEDVADDMASIFTGQTRPLRRYGLDLTNATLKEWALKNGLDADIKSMSQAEKTMLRYQYVMANSEHIMGDFARTADTWANVVRTLGQQFQKLGQIIGGGLINLFKPLLMQIRSFMYGAIETVQNAVNAIGKLLGWQIEIENVGVTLNDEMEDYADNLDDAAGSAKKLNAQLRGIDELNNLTSSNKGGSGSDDGLLGTLGGLNNKGNEARLNIEHYESEINSWYEFGKKIRDKIINGFKDIDWEYVSQQVKENAKGFRDTLKGLLFPDRDGNTLGGEIGAFLAEAINLGLDWLVTATADQEVWEAAGHNIADFFTKFFEHFDAKDAADAINNIVGGLVKMLTAAVGDLSEEENRNKIISKFKEFFENIKPETWGTIALTLGVITIAKVGKWFLSNVVTKNLVDFLSDKLSGIPVAIKAKLTPEFGLSFSQAFSSAMAGEFSTMDLSTIFGAGTFSEIAGTIGAGFVGGIVAALGGSRIGISGGAIMATLAEENGVKGFSADAYEEYMNFGGVFKMFKDLGLAIKDCVADTDIAKGAFASWGEEMKEFFIGEGSAIANFIQDWKDAIDILKDEEWVKKLLEMGENIYGSDGFWAKFGRKIKEAGVSIANWWKQDVAPWFTKARWNELALAIKDGISMGWDSFTRWWQNTALVQWWNTKVAPWFTKEKWSSVAVGIKEGLVQAFNNAIAAIKGVWNTFAEFLNSKLTFEWDDVKVAGKTIIEAGKLELGKIPTFAQGGYPTPGSLFVAGEAGPEMLGTVGGRTAVASNGEITGISATIRQTSSEEIALLRQQNQLLQGILQKEFGISSKDIYKSVRASDREFRNITGTSGFAY